MFVCFSKKKITLNRKREMSYRVSTVPLASVMFQENFTTNKKKFLHSINLPDIEYKYVLFNTDAL